MIVYIVTELFTDDWSLRGIFSTRDKAEFYIKNLKGYHGVLDIEEYEIDMSIDKWK